MKVAAIQANVVFNDPRANADRAARDIGRLASERVQLAVLPECFLTGYCVDSQKDAERIAISREHPAINAVRVAADRTGVIVAVGFAESEGERLYNTVALFEPRKAAQYYRKSHLPFLGFDRFAIPGDQLPVFETALGRIGILICFDQRLPEPARVLSLAGADLIVLPTNWPVGAETSADIMCIARAAENRVWLVTANRVGNENGFEFIGRSKIISPTGAVIAAAGCEEAVITANIDLGEARQKRTVNIPGRYEMEVFKSRRPGLYGSLMDEV
ncbi:MAG: carbon-nitrogen hydrolase family protein [Fimbriimonadaceae bacterium]